MASFFEKTFINNRIDYSDNCYINEKDSFKYNYVNQTSKKINEQKIDFDKNTKNWDLLDSTSEKPKLSKANSTCSLNLLINSPRILELDINRMFISQNKIS
jgi:hypothetical protein